MQHRVVITGIGAVSPMGNDAKSFLDSVFASKTGIAPITHFDSSNTGVTLAAEVKDFDPLQRLDKKVSKRMDDFSRYAVYSAMEAMEQAGLKKGEYDPKELGVIYGSGIGGLTTIQQQAIKMSKKGPGRVSPFFVPNSIINMAAGNISINLDARNTSQAIVTACASGTNAIGDAFERIQYGKAKMMITGGSEASVNELGISGFAALSALSTAENVEDGSMPFDKDRNGFVMGEGAGTLVLEDLEHAKARGANILGEIVGYGTNSDAYHLTAPRPDGSGAMDAMKLALEDAGISTKDVDYVNAHGTSTHANDSAESKAISSVFSDNDHIKVSSTKGMTGHALGAAGSLEAVIMVGALQRQQMPVNVGLKNKDPEVEVDLVNEDNKKAPVNYEISNSFGFGGHNAVLAFKKYEDD
ncbi:MULTISPECIES: beta-ketoacyl-ACP synthase II [Apilactobacillus]|uniref:3-oxoacyl-[acyl-carrier-protein] synthase 2 n=2 Tax=Apilactobacillus TaxID=2767877 RepID=A0ABY2YYC2_9LACO|nr:MULTISPECIES: beta-ketoacyl-ACP synthase II [Apilactobacillus]TPR14769.1 beta-ketoacyl-[acyl-carrier-protein] synthase II [Apilactobacillus timberlakei]TPR15736.1 beta-ketoacyl-[acyl-carrier-protein] synthase II [Apilactobacillus timberlakei]TPR16097.1 beta-ketoacyl-[acyl-carrier-protein] synthase II [Apilactobacillus timberlakei]TPR18211.1 beta-ketoacyl-[acyl-carrier-protein] synthase II [Apilactobacillus timberlakei]TPR18844.1 beta-ketoacyl-[acyl-carrier-protein] synthase II [Apilactobaci